MLVSKFWSFSWDVEEKEPPSGAWDTPRAYWLSDCCLTGLSGAAMSGRRETPWPQVRTWDGGERMRSV